MAPKGRAVCTCPFGIYMKVSSEEEKGTSKWRIITVVVCQYELMMEEKKRKRKTRRGSTTLYSSQFDPTTVTSYREYRGISRFVLIARRFLLCVELGTGHIATLISFSDPNIPTSFA